MSFNFEDKVKWSELSPSLQKRFTDIENLTRSQAKQDLENQLNGTRITIGKRAPSNPVNNKELWIDEKYRIARAFNENYWEFTRAVWAKSSTLSTPDDPARTDIDHTGDAGGGTYTPSTPPTLRRYKLFTYTDNGTTSNLIGTSESIGTMPSGDDFISYSYIGTNPSAEIVVDLTGCNNANSDLLAYLFIAVGDISDSKKSHATGYAYEISVDALKRQHFRQTSHKVQTGASWHRVYDPIYTLVLGSDVIKTGKYIMGDVESKNRGAREMEYLTPADASNDIIDATKFSESQYPYPYPTSRLGAAIIPGYTDQGGSKPRPPFVAVNGSMKITIKIFETK